MIFTHLQENKTSLLTTQVKCLHVPVIFLIPQFSKVQDTHMPCSHHRTGWRAMHVHLAYSPRLIRGQDLSSRSSVKHRLSTTSQVSPSSPGAKRSPSLFSYYSKFMETWQHQCTRDCVPGKKICLHKILVSAMDHMKLHLVIHTRSISYL